VPKAEGGPVRLIWAQPDPPPRRQALGREPIVVAAVALADEAGADALTMQAVAARLGSYSAMALYRYVGSKDGLVDLMLDRVAGEISVPGGPGADWRADLHALAVATRQMIQRHPWFAALYHTRPPVGPHLMRRLEFMLTVLVAQGATVAAAMTFAALIDRHIVGSGLQEAEEARMSRRLGLDDEAALQDALAAVRELADGRFPLLAGWLARPSGPSPGEQFELGLRFLLDGIAGELAGREVLPARSVPPGPVHGEGRSCPCRRFLIPRCPTPPLT
jgi:AcrR family transcriptional regulator